MDSTRRTSRLLVWTTLLLGGVLAQQDNALSSRLAALAGTGLSIAECRERMQNMGTMLDGAGYGTARTHHLSDGTLAARWYNPATERTAVAFAGQQATDNAFSTAELDGQVRWNEFIAMP
ncbi:hypothetical protein DEDE109153_17050 [Deinococcus deserti]|nr:hypothetical protein [Deinococcus deserti]